MEPARLLSELEDLAARLGVDVVYENLQDSERSMRGGLCRVMGKWTLIVGSHLDTSSRIDVLIDGLSRMNLEEVYVTPYVRSLLESSGRI